MDAGTLRISLELLALDSSGAALGSFTSGILGIIGMLGALGEATGGAADALAILVPALAGAGAAFGMFLSGATYAVEAGAALQNAGTMASIAISDGAQHVNELENAIVNLANTSQYKIADVDMAFRILGGLGFDTQQILAGLGQQTIILAQAMGGPGAGVSAADAAQLLGQAIYLFGQNGLTAKTAADELTGAFYNNMMSVSGLTEFMGMAGGTASSLNVSFGQLLTFGSMLTPMFGSASSAGASLSYMMRNLAHPATAAMAAEIQSLGLQIYNSQGQFVGLKSIMDQLFQVTAGMTQQQKMDVFGTLFNVRSGRAAMDMMNQTQSSFDAEYNKIYGRITTVNQAQRDSTDINNTTIGTWNRLTTTLNDFFAKAGVGIDTALIPLMNAFNALLSVLQQNSGFEKFLGVFLVAGTIIGGLALVIGIAVAAIAMFSAAVAIAAGVFAGVVIVAGLIAGAFLLISSHTQQANGVLSAIVGVFSAVGNAIRNAFSTLVQIVTPAFQAIAQFASQVAPIANSALSSLGGAARQLGTAFAGLLPVVQDVGQLLSWLWQNVISHVLQIIMGLLIPMLEAAGMALVTFFTGLVMTVSGVIQTIFGIMQVGIGLLQMIFGTIIALITGHTDQAQQIFITGWNNIKTGVTNIVQGLGNAILGILTGTFGAVASLIGGFVAGVVNFFQNLSDILVGHSIIPDMANAIVAVMAALPGRMMSAISSVVGSVVGVFNNLENSIMSVLHNIIGQAASAGGAIMQGLASGISGAIGAVTGAISNVASIIAAHLPHSPAKTGPLSGDTMAGWGPAITSALSTGLLGGLGNVQGAVGTLAGAINFSSPGVVGARGASALAGNGQQQQFTVNMQVDNQTLAQSVFTVVNGQLRQNGYTRMNR